MKYILIPGSVGWLLVALLGCSSPGGKSVSGEKYADLGGRPAAPPGDAPGLGKATNVTGVTVTNQISPDLLRPPGEAFTLGPGDKLEIEIIGNPTSRALTTVGPDGKMYYNLLSGLDVWGLTLSQTRNLVQEQLAKYLTEPQVTLVLREVASKQVWLIGRLNKPGIYPMAAPMSLLEALALAGGSARSSSIVTTAELADLRHSFVMRQGQLLPVDFYRLLREGDTSQNIYLQPDDFVFVPSALAQEVYVLGAVRFPRTVPYHEQMTLVSAIAGASGAATVEWLSGVNLGTQPDAYLSHVAIVRGSLVRPQVSVVDYQAIVKGKSPDVLLEPGDIVFVPNTPISTLKRYVNTIVSTFVTTVFANEGIRAGGGTVNVGVSVPVGK